MKHIVIDYPEAQCLAQHLAQSRHINLDATWKPFGVRPETLKANLRPVPDDPFIVINGSGNYHHETYAIVEGLSRRARCRYVHIDAHPDKDTYFRWKLDCASFVGGIMEIPQVAEAVVLGLHLTEDLEDFPNVVLGNELSKYRCDFFSRLRQYTARPSELEEAHFDYNRADGVKARSNSSVKRARARRLPKNDKGYQRGLMVCWDHLAQFDAGSLGGDPVYLSVDLDVLRSAVVTDWRRTSGVAKFTSLQQIFGGAPRAVDASKRWADNQGDLELPELLELIAAIGQSSRVIGADMCGLTEEFALLPAERLQSSLAAIDQVYDALVAAINRP